MAQRKVRSKRFGGQALVYVFYVERGVKCASEGRGQLRAGAKFASRENTKYAALRRKMLKLGIQKW